MVDGTQLYEDAIKRIQQLEKLNATLAAEIDLMRPVITAVHGHRNYRKHGWSRDTADEVLHKTYDTYEANRPK